MSLKAGNDYCRQSLYNKALIEYGKIDKGSPLYQYDVFNMEYVRRRIICKIPNYKKQL
ncbi:MAG: hypothetical protein LBF12_01625 [Christensenellaceae bacterium]|nr:hypothetical protein [Christensenellaceae bacterium]